MNPKLMWLVLVGTLAGAVTFAATTGVLDRLPPDFVYPRGEESPGPVTFRHETHVDPGNPDCTTCHPTQWKITEPNATADGRPATHERFDKGELCGACHDGDRGFKMRACDSCHDVFADEEEEDEAEAEDNDTEGEE